MTGLACGCFELFFWVTTSGFLVDCRTGLGFLAAFITPHAVVQALLKWLHLLLDLHLHLQRLLEVRQFNS